MTEVWKDRIIGGAVVSLLLGIPLIGCALAVVTQNYYWLWLLVPLLAFHEGGIFLGGVAIFVVCVLLAV